MTGNISLIWKNKFSFCHNLLFLFSGWLTHFMQMSMLFVLIFSTARSVKDLILLCPFVRRNKSSETYKRNKKSLRYKSKFFRASFLCFPPQQITPLSVGMTKYAIATKGLIDKLGSNWMIFPKELYMVITNNILKFQAILCRIKACQTILLTSIFRGLFG